MNSYAYAITAINTWISCAFALFAAENAYYPIGLAVIISIVIFETWAAKDRPKGLGAGR